MERKTILKDAGVLLIVVVMVLSTVMMVAGNTIKNSESNITSDSGGFEGVKSIESSGMLLQLYERYTMTCVPAFGYYRDSDTLKACVSADGGFSWFVAGGSISENRFDARNNCMPSQNGDCPEDMISYWKGDGDATDNYGSNDGTYSGSGYVTGQVDQAFSFDGVDDYMEVPDDSSLQLGTGDFTLEAWIKASTSQTDYPAIIAKRTSDDPGDSGFLFGLWSNGCLHIQIGGINNGQGNTVLTNNNWYHVAVTRTGTVVTYYVNGVSDGVETANNDASAIGDNLFIGKDDKSPSTTLFNGIIDEVAVYDRGLSKYELLGHYNAGLDNRGYCDVEDDIYVDPLGNAIVEKIADGYLVSNIDDSGDNGALLTAEPAYNAVSTEIDLNNITPGAENSISYFSLTGDFSFGVTVGNGERGVYPVGFRGSSSGAPSILGTLKGKNIFSYTFEIATSCGAFVSDKGVYPVGFKGTASGAPSIIGCDIPDGSKFTWKHGAETWEVDHVEIKHTPTPPYTIGIGSCTITGKYPPDFFGNTGSFTIKNLHASDPADTPVITGPTSGKAGTEYPYTISTTDPNNDDVYYFVNWGDDKDTGWIGPYHSGESVSVKHTWSEKGTYTIKAKAKDTNGFESEWKELSVTMPRNRAINSPLFLQFLQNFLENHPNLFPVLQKIIQRLGLQQ
jgi:hypothetical protein